MKCPTTPTSKLVGLGYFPFARRYLENRILLYFPSGTKMFQFPEFVLRYLMYSGRYTVPLRTVGCPIRKSPDQLTYSFLRHIGVSPVLRRLLVPRHSPCALVHLTKI